MSPPPSPAAEHSVKDELEGNLRRIRARIRACCGKYGRDPDSVRLVAVGKQHPAERIAALAALGQRDFGENYLQEADRKMDWCHDHAPCDTHGLAWHFIGHVQSRKCRDIAGRFHWVHTVGSVKVATRLNQHRGDRRLNVLIQVNIDDESTKAGVGVDQLPDLAGTVSTLSNLHLRGLMVIPRARDTFEQQRQVFARCRRLQDSLIREGLALDQLSMGMTADMEAAIAEGATLVRIGTALFGPRPPSA